MLTRRQCVLFFKEESESIETSSTIDNPNRMEKLKEV
jgi:hypothetical protein